MIPFILGFIGGFAFAILLLTIYAVNKGKQYEKSRGGGLD